MTPLQPEQLEAYRGRNRVVLVFTQSHDESYLSKSVSLRPSRTVLVSVTYLSSACFQARTKVPTCGVTLPIETTVKAF